MAEDEGEGLPTESSNQNQSPELGEETWEVIIKISDDDLKKSNVKHLRSPDDVASEVKVQPHEPGVEVNVQSKQATLEVKGHPEAPPSANGEVFSNENFEQSVRALSVKKKKPPPMRPTPYSEKTPPIPPKKKRVGPIQEEPDGEWAEQPHPPAEKPHPPAEVEEHLYEVVDRSDLRWV